MSGDRGLYACIDVGTTRVKLSLYDSELARKHFESYTVPVSAEGLQDAEELFRVVKHLFDKGKELGARSAGLSTYRASVVAWNQDGTPLTPVVTWTDRSVFSTYRKLSPMVRLAGKVPPFDLIISPYSPLMKFLRLRELKPSLAEDSMQWTIDAYLAYRLTGRYVSDATNACLTGLIDPRTMKEIGVVRSLFKLKSETPEVVENAEAIGAYGGIGLNALIADQQAASVAEGALTQGVAKVTNGTGTFVDIPTERFSRRGDLIPVVLLKHKSKVWFGVEGYLPTTGRAADMLLAMGFIKDYAELEVRSDKGVVFVPALSGLQVPRAPNAKGLVAGLDLTSDKASLLAGLLKSVAFHVKLVVEQSGEKVKALRTDGGLSKLNALMDMIATSTGIRVERRPDLEATSRGLALLQLASLGEGTIESFFEAGGEAEVFSGTGDTKMEAEYLRWKNLTKLLKSSKASSLAE